MSDQATSAADISLAADFTTPSQQDWEKEVLKSSTGSAPKAGNWTSIRPTSA